MKSLFVAWEDTRSGGGWFPVGRLDADIAAERYEFRYVQGALQAEEECGFVPFDSFPDFRKEYVSGELFPFFANRLQNPNRPSFPEYLRRLDLDKGQETAFDPIEVLAVSEGRRATDSLEVFPKVERTEGGTFEIKFFLHELGYLPRVALDRILKLQPGEDLSIAIQVERRKRSRCCGGPIEATNQATEYAIQLQTRDRLIIGYAPRYLLNDLFEVISRCSLVSSAQVSRVNPPPAPLGQRVLVVFKGCWPDGYQPMSGEEFRALAGAESTPSQMAFATDP
jgi:hypothetical protein